MTITHSTSQTPSHPHPVQLAGILRRTGEFLLVVIVVLALFHVVTARVVVEGVSMEPAFHTGQMLLVSKVHYQVLEPQRGDIVVFHRPGDVEREYIKRVIGLPEEAVELRDGRVYVNGDMLDESYVIEPCTTGNCPNSIWQVDADAYFVMGDNRNHSNDSRSFGAIPREFIVGKAVLRYWPFSEIRWLHQIGLSQ